VNLYRQVPKIRLWDGLRRPEKLPS
jgi:hypothetical protein